MNKSFLNWQRTNLPALLSAGFVENTMEQLDWVGAPERKFKDIRNQRDAVAEEKAVLCKQIGSICNKVPKNYSQMDVIQIRSFKKDREAAMKVAGSKRSSINDLTAALSNMQRYA